VTQDSFKNQFLLAMPNLLGTYFADTIAYICDHNDGGAMGIMLNRPMSITLADLLKQLKLPCNIDETVPVIEGGPVQQERGFILHSDDIVFANSQGLKDGLMLTTSLEVLEAIGRGEGPCKFLVALGYTGWGSGQLEGEVEEDGWLTCPSSNGVIFDVPFENRVDHAAQALGINFSLIPSRTGNA
jgi:putative transcriptional regulator